MKLVLFWHHGRVKAGRMEKNDIVVLETEDCDLDRLGVASLIDKPINDNNETLPLDSVKLLAPIPRPARNIFCVGKNYYDHAHEFANSGFDSSAASGAVPSHPIVFSKVPESVIGPDRCSG